MKYKRLTITMVSGEPHYPLNAFSWALRGAADELDQLQKEYDVNIPYPIGFEMLHEHSELSLTLAEGELKIEAIENDDPD